MKSKSVFQVSSFIIVGCSAAAVHLGVVIALVRVFAWAPLWANPLAWVIAFCVSFSGHWLLTFRARKKLLWAAVARFFAISAGGFLINQLLYAVILDVSNVRFDLILAVVLVLVAIATYFLSSVWAFADRSNRN